MKTIDIYLNDVWKNTFQKIVESGQVPEASLPYFEAKLLSLDDNVAEIEVPLFMNYSIMSQYHPVIENCLSDVLQDNYTVKLTKKDQNEKNKIIEDISEGFYVSKYITRKLDENQTFANFVVGKSNAQAQVASLTCATNPGMIYNPLFIYGASGLGKTHLLNAIGNHYQQLFPDKHIVFLSGIEFVEAVHKAYMDNKFDDFKNYFNTVDLLLVDDIQFIANKPKTHEIFFTIFNYLVNNRKQICLTSDRTPDEIKGLEERIVSRFNQGLNVNIEAPEFETSVNILKMKFYANPSSVKLNIEPEVFDYIASNFSQDVRSLEGAVNRLLFYSINFPISEDDDTISLKLAMQAFSTQIKETKSDISVSLIRRRVCDYYNLTKQQITSANRTKNISNARQIAMYLCRKLLDTTYDDIGREFGGRDHSTVMSSIETVEKKIKSEPLILKAINEIEATIK
ncbi:MAG: chromosomal replication initiator protein DnaA [Erysipelotrichaceae bacterium]|nr:chromosomal replication initiator protein DnaA [Erysipelotrichaceae bacterium]